MKLFLVKHNRSGPSDTYASVVLALTEEDAITTSGVKDWNWTSSCRKWREEIEATNCLNEENCEECDLYVPEYKCEECDSCLEMLDFTVTEIDITRSSNVLSASHCC